MAAGEVTIGVVGLGLMGGSVAVKLRKEGFLNRAVGCDINPDHGKRAVELGIVDDVVDIKRLSSESDIIVLAIPVDKAIKILPDIMKNVTESTVVLDLGSTKEKIAQAADKLPNRGQFVACHPIAGTENSGPDAAFDSLFDGKVNIICDKEKTSEIALEKTIKLFEILGMRNKFMDSKSHDRHIAYVSHLSHVSSFVLGQTVLEVEKDEASIFDMAGSGFDSTVRLAKSSPTMWAPIFTENADNLLLVLDRYIKNLNEFRTLIEERNDKELNQAMTEINVIRKVLKG
ncbi:MAG: prephenate dehydrogenase [Bacteroidota bacterium]